MAPSCETFAAMGTRISVVLLHAEASDTQREIRGLIESCEARLSVYRPTSELSKLNARGHLEPVALDEEVLALLARCKRWSGQLRGAFDPTGGQIQDLVIDLRRATAHFARGPGRVDLGGIGKGYCLDQIRAALSARGVRDAFISFGESSILALGHPPGTETWEVGITNPYRPEGEAEILKVLPLSDQCLSISNSVRGGRWGREAPEHHVFDPRSGAPIRGERLVAVVADSGTTSEVLSTAGLVMDQDAFAEALDEHAGCVAFEAVARGDRIDCYELV